MKKKLLFIIPGIVILLLVFGVWVYLMVFGVPDDQNDVFANLGVGEESSTFVPEVPEPESIITPPAPAAPDALRQLTIRPVAGAVLVETDGISKVRYAERGTGHIYEINPNGEGEIRLSGTTIPRVTNAVFSPDGNQVALIKEELFATEVTVGTFVTNESGDAVLESFGLPFDARNVVFSEDSSAVRFTITSSVGTRGYQEDIASGAREQLFNILLTDIVLDWRRDDAFYMHTKPSAEREGFVYRLRGNELLRVVPGGHGLVTLINDAYVLRSQSEGTGPLFEAIDRETGEAATLPLSMLPEKCAFSPKNEQRVWCAAPITLPLSMVYPDDWYKGLAQLSDSLWEINIPAQEAILQSDFTADTSRTIDVTKLSTNGLAVLFVNRLDGTLWIFDSTI